LGALICERIASGESLVAICADEDMPHRQRVHEWLAGDPEFADKYARAREDQADTLADEIVSIADNGTGDSNRDRLRVDARKWVAAKLKPKKYGERQTLEHEGAVGTYVLRAPEPAKDASEWLKSSGLHSPAHKPTS
jgi:hypothetical protein